ncbi:MAG: amidohydrolase family protein [Clostridia bacterium]|nr:amidohydrolase family protein [Clostridia bacterium]
MIIDFHTHIFPDKIAHSTVSALAKNASIEPHCDGTMAGLLSQMEESGVDISVNLPVLTRPRQYDSVKAFAKELNEKSYKGARIISFAGVHPDMENALERLKEIKREGFLGIKIHPDYQDKFIDDDSYVKLLQYAKELDLITVTHAGLDGAYVGQPIKCTPKRVMNLLDKIGGYEKLVLAHMGANELFDEVYNTLASANVYIDTAYVLHSIGRDMFEKILVKHTEDRVLFATDSPWQHQGKEIEIIKSYKLGDSVEEKIFSQNARKLLKI